MAQCITANHKRLTNRDCCKFLSKAHNEVDFFLLHHLIYHIWGIHSYFFSLRQPFKGIFIKRKKHGLPILVVKSHLEAEFKTRILQINNFKFNTYFEMGINKSCGVYKIQIRKKCSHCR